MLEKQFKMEQEEEMRIELRITEQNLTIIDRLANGMGLMRDVFIERMVFIFFGYFRNDVEGEYHEIFTKYFTVLLDENYLNEEIPEEHDMQDIGVSLSNALVTCMNGLASAFNHELDAFVSKTMAFALEFLLEQLKNGDFECLKEFFDMELIIRVFDAYIDEMNEMIMTRRVIR